MKTMRLALHYLTIIMVLSIAFSMVLYTVSSRELVKQLEPPTSIKMPSSAPNPSSTQNFRSNSNAPEGDIDASDRKERVQQSLRNLQYSLFLLNGGLLFIGMILSYYLARRTLQPIDAAIRAQSQFASDASHELRTPLTVMQMEMESGLRSLKLSADAKRLLKSNLEELSHLIQLSESLLRLARESKAIKLYPVWADEAVSIALNRVAEQAQMKNIVVNDNTPHLLLHANTSSLVEVLVILLDNAIKYSPPGTSININASSDKKQAFISIQDEGTGIAKNHLPHIFDRFYSGAASTGHGLGLAIAKAFILRQHGDIIVESVLHAGSTFTVKIPLSRGK